MVLPLTFEDESRLPGRNRRLNKSGLNDQSEIIELRRYEGTDIENTGIPVDPQTCLYDYDPNGNREQATEGKADPIINNTNELNQYANLTGTVSVDPINGLGGNIGRFDGKGYAWYGDNRLVAVTSLVPAEGDQKSISYMPNWAEG